MVHFDPAHTFTLHNMAGELLVALPPTVGVDGPIGQPPQYEWDRPPGSSAWYPLGDGVPNRPVLRLTGTWAYDSVDEARQHTAQIREALQNAAEVRWLGSNVGNLRRDVPGSYTYTTGARYCLITHNLVLNLTAPPKL